MPADAVLAAVSAIIVNSVRRNVAECMGDVLVECKALWINGRFAGIVGKEVELCGR